MVACFYLPYDCDKFYDDYCFYLDKIRCIIDAASTPYIFVLGDFNADLKSESVFGSELIEFCDVNNLCLIDKSMLLPDSFTYFSEAHGSTSWLDHCMTTKSGKSLISDISIENTFICSDHFPLCVNIVCDISPISTTCNVVDNKTYNMPKWNQVCNSDKCKYESCTLKLSRDIVIPSEALLCRDAKCKVHRNDINCFYKSIMSSLKQATNECIPSSINSTKKFIPVPGWNDYVKEQHYIARHAFKWWNLNNRPLNGFIYHEMRTSRARFKYALRFTRNIEDTARADSLAKDLSVGAIDGFWDNVRKLNSGNTFQANTIDGVSGETDISNYWKDHFCKLLNTNYCDTILKSSIMSKLDNVQYSNDMIISIKLIQEAVGNLECGKSAGPDGIFAESIKFAHHRIHVLLSLCFSLCLTHGYMPLDMIKTTIVPVIKNKCGNLADSNNYRPIAIATIVSKLYESTILYKCEDFLKTCDNQFGFKRKHSTEFCIYTLKEFIDYYKQRGTTIFVTFLDASKAFDKIDFWLLFEKLITKDFPVFIIKILAYWYCHQEMHVRWGSTSTSSFHVSNGVKQGGILSPMLFNVYMDQLSIRLNRSGIGGDIGGHLINHLCYADDLCLISLSSAGMQSLLDICNSYAIEHVLTYNSNKSYSLCFKPKHIKFARPCFYLNRLEIPRVDQCKYLGIMICTKNCDIDLKRQMRKFYANINILSRKFAKCSPDVKCTLFKSFCSNMYCSTMWYNGTVTAMRKLRIAYNNSLRRLLGIPKYNSASEMFVQLNIKSFGELLRKYVFCFINRLTISDNSILVSICDSSVPIFSNIWNWWYDIVAL